MGTISKEAYDRFNSIVVKRIMGVARNSCCHNKYTRNLKHYCHLITALPCHPSCSDYKGSSIKEARTLEREGVSKDADIIG